MRTDADPGARPWLALDSMDVDRAGLPTALAFCDITGDDLFRSETDVELSHWYPNQTPGAFRADTSTEMVLRFVAEHADHRLVGVGGHCDTDAALSLFALVHPQLAVEHERLLAATAETGDFGFWPDDEVARLYGDVRAAWEPRPGDQVRDRFERSFAAVLAVLSGASRGSSRAAEVQQRSDALLDNGVGRRQVSDRFVAFVVDGDHTAEHLTALRGEPRFDQPIGDLVWASHRTRNRVDAERVQLLSVPSDGGWVHTIWYPQYLPWDTSTLWRPDGLHHTGARLEWQWSLPHLDDALAKLQAAELTDVRWRRADLLAPWAPGFPILASAGLVDGASAAAGPDDVIAALDGVWT